MDEQEGKMLTLVARKACFGLPTACPSCLPVYVFLKFTGIPFLFNYNLAYPDSVQIPYVETGECYVAYNNENGGVIDTLKQDGIADLDSGLDAIPEWISMKAMITSWLADAVMYELWMGSDGTSARKIYYSDLPWPISKFLYYKQVTIAKQLLGITKENADQREKEIYRKATKAYEALSARLGEDLYFFESRPTSLDALLLGHVLFTLHALPVQILGANQRGKRQRKRKLLEEGRNISWLPSLLLFLFSSLLLVVQKTLIWSLTMMMMVQSMDKHY
ncbi:mitochondrial outer membrane import complex protein METAXIN isoform X2 [Daucus carota subsp. sativus]|uniref:mitochondrial outer membrane import complex protein METAXIN isoform X2 n=1 Tax=Daucus carota subsp. sativus TaxID=79200 RepID=UPI003082E91A